MKLKKKQPFREILDFKEEYKQYKALCMNKHTEWTHYDDWEKHILENFKKIPIDQVNNYKHYLMLNSLLDAHALKFFLPVAVAFISLYAGSYVIGVLDINGISLTFLMMIYFFCRDYFNYVLENKFSDDILKVFEKYEKEIL